MAVVRAGAVGERELTEALHWQYHFDASTYTEEIRADVPAYDEFQDEVARASGVRRRRILDLGTGTGETARRVLARHPGASLVGIDENEGMLAVARARLPAERVELRVGRIEDPLPEGPFDLVTSALCVHHLDGAGKADLFRRVHAALAPGGLFVLGDVVVPVDPAFATMPLTPGYDRPSPLGRPAAMAREAGFEPRVAWEQWDLAVVAARASLRPRIWSREGNDADRFRCYGRSASERRRSAVRLLQPPAVRGRSGDRRGAGAMSSSASSGRSR